MKNEPKNREQLKETENKDLDALELSEDALEKISGGNWWHYGYDGQNDPMDMFNISYDEDGNRIG